MSSVTVREVVGRLGGGSGKGKGIASQNFGKKPSSRRKTVEVGDLLQSCRKGSQQGSRDLGFGHGHDNFAAGSTTSVSGSSNRQVDVMDNHLAIAANSGFAVYVLSLHQNEGENRDSLRILSRHEFSQVRAIRFARTNSGDGFGLALVSLVIIQEDGEIAVWSYRTKRRQEGFMDKSGRAAGGNGTWQLVSRIPPPPCKMELISHAILTMDNILTVLCLNREAEAPQQDGASNRGKVGRIGKLEDLFPVKRAVLERVDLQMCGSIEEDGGGDLSPRNRKRATRSMLGEIAGADCLLCPSPGDPNTTSHSSQGGSQLKRVRFWVICSKRNTAFLWNLEDMRCVRKVPMMRNPSHLCIHNPSGDLLWVTQSHELCIHKCEREEGGEGGAPVAETVRLLSHLDQSSLRDQQIVTMLSIGPFLWVACTPDMSNARQNHKSLTVFAFHSMSGTCVGKQTLKLPGDGEGGEAGGSLGPTYTLLMQGNSLSTYLVSAGGFDAGKIWKCQLKVPAAMSSVVANVLRRLNSTHNTGGTTEGSKPSAKNDLNLLSHMIKGELSQWGNALQQQRREAELAQMELISRLGDASEIEEILAKNPAAHALLIQSRVRENELAKILAPLIRKEVEKKDSVTSVLTNPQHTIDKSTRAVLVEFLDQIENPRGEAKPEEWWSSSVIVVGSSSTTSYNVGRRVRLCLYFFNALLKTVVSRMPEEGESRAVQEIEEIFLWFAAHIEDENSLESLKERTKETLVKDFAREFALFGRDCPTCEDEDENLYFDIAYEITCLMLYLVLPDYLVGFVLSYGQTMAAGGQGSANCDTQNEAVRGYAFRATCVLPALHIQGHYETPPRPLLETQVHSQAKLMVCAGHPLCALHVLCKLESEEASGGDWKRSFQLLEWMRNSGIKDELQDQTSILVEHFCCMLLRSKHQELRSEAGLLLQTLSSSRNPESGDTTVVESIIQESISSLIDIVLY
ncbi:hypothetical protein HOP50_13g70890 [Chloropicon primus]|uniref:Uncharacterized protein n=3 Tax=Chloropicon primus TaxID=1764295 RepID=A0A5B8MW25_9CHLO|nr:hypothetical protein A3770_13p70690 [Chloropicon primus]UPR03759.1 hypothetical protein HOP50_13g70890 [Chloropicon primus]|eukprot:QDZ24551.1 hypothetical protein A3770_13p70690 [Chloropicon primus]